MGEEQLNWRHDLSSRLETLDQYAALVQSISEYLFDADPVGLNYEDNTDEYDSEAQTIVIRFLEETKPLAFERAREIVVEEFEWWFGEIDGAEQYVAISAEILKLFEGAGGQL